MLASSIFLTGVLSLLLVTYLHKMKMAEFMYTGNGVIFNIDRTGNCVCLTIDDVPYDVSADTFSKILDALKNHGAKATFFVISSLVNEENKPLLVKSVQDGHHLANHGRSNRMHARLSSNDLIAEIEDCERLIGEIYGLAGMEAPSVKYYRPGSGFVSKAILDYCSEKDYRIALGSNYPSDPQIWSGFVIRNYVLHRLQRNDIIILHDRKWTADALDGLLGEIKKRDYDVVSLLGDS